MGVNHWVEAARIQLEHLNERPGLLRPRGQQKAVAVAHQAAVAAFALALRKDLAHKITGWIEHLNPRVGYEDVAGGRHRHGRNVFELASAVASAPYGFQQFAGRLEDKYGSEAVVGHHDVVVQVQRDVDGLFEVVVGEAAFKRIEIVLQIRNGQL